MMTQPAGTGLDPADPDAEARRAPGASTPLEDPGESEAERVAPPDADPTAAPAELGEPTAAEDGGDAPVEPTAPVAGADANEPGGGAVVANTET